MELALPFPDSTVDAEAEEQSVLAYAREQGITTDYTTDLPSLHAIQASLRETADLHPSDALDIDTELTTAVAAAQALTKQRLCISSADAALLKCVLDLRERPGDELATEGRRVRGLKCEVPVLRTDHEMDMLGFGKRGALDLRDLRAGIPEEVVDEEGDEGFGWPGRYCLYPAVWDERVGRERLGVMRDGLRVLQGVVEDGVVAGERERVLVEEMEGRRGLLPRHLTPPLLPLSPPLTPYIPSSPANRLPLCPDSSDSVAAEAKALEQQIMAGDSLARHYSGSSDSMLLDVAEFDALFAGNEATSPPSSDHIPTILKRKADDLKVEGPLTPPIFSDSPMKKLKSVSFSTMIQVGNTLEPWSDDFRPGTSDSRSPSDEFFKEIEPIAKEAKRKAENEKLTGADTVSRVDVPVLDFTLPAAPWDEFSQRKNGKHRPCATELEAQMRYLQRVKQDDLKCAVSWHGVSDLDFRWGWFASPTTSIKLDEKLHGETEFVRIQAELRAGNIATSATEVWKKDGLRVLDEDEDEEEIEPAEFEERNDIESLIRKRKMELEEEEEIAGEQRKRKEVAARSNSGIHPQRDGGSHYWQDGLSLLQDKPAVEQEETPTELMFGGFSASTALHKFMETQGRAIKSAKPTAGVKVPSTPRPQSLSVCDRDSSSVIQREGPSARLPPGPPPPLNLPPGTFIVSSTLLPRRTLVKQVEYFHSSAELIYRDYTLPNSAFAEADIILSPSTGIILTTLQQIKQAPLPGQVARSPVKERMATLQERYERLVVLVSESLREELGYSRPEDVRDKETLSGLAAFAAQLDGDVVVQYIRGGEQMLARAIAESMGTYGLPHGGKDMGSIELSAVETTWEIFLRRAGLNPFAAQVILASLAFPTSVSLPPLSSSPTPHSPWSSADVVGLPQFVLMSEEERIRRFQAVMGGTRVLGRVSRLLDQRWLSAVNGFRM